MKPAVDIISLLCERISHGLREPIGIALAAIEDMKSGYPLSERDFDDASVAGKRIVSHLQMLRIPKPCSEAECNSVSLGVVLSDALDECACQESSLFIRRRISTGGHLRSLDVKLVRSAFRALILYAAQFTRGQEQNVLEVYFDSTFYNEVLRIVSQVPANSFLKIRNAPRTLVELAELDPTVQAIGLIQFESVCALYSGSATVWRSRPLEFTFTATFPL